MKSPALEGLADPGLAWAFFSTTFGRRTTRLRRPFFAENCSRFEQGKSIMLALADNARARLHGEIQNSRAKLRGSPKRVP
jgi:hypothetical protein